MHTKKERATGYLSIMLTTLELLVSAPPYLNGCYLGKGTRALLKAIRNSFQKVVP